MLRIRSHVGIVLLAVLAMFAFACGGGGGEGDESSMRDAEWTTLQAEHQALTEARAELVDLEMQLLEAQAMGEEVAVAEPAEEAEGEEGAMEEPTEEPLTAEELAAKTQELESQVVTMSEDFGTHLVDFINADPVYQGEEPTARQKEAFRLKSSEDILLGQEYIDKGGDYRRAIEIFEAALMVDPDNPDVVAALEKAKQDRFMTEERFSLVSNNMSEDQVRALLGQVFHHNVREYPEKNVVAWFYPKEEGGAAGVYFEMNEKTEAFQVYRVDFNAVKAPTEEGGEGEEEGAPEP